MKKIFILLCLFMQFSLFAVDENFSEDTFISFSWNVQERDLINYISKLNEKENINLELYRYTKEKSEWEFRGDYKFYAQQYYAVEFKYEKDKIKVITLKAKGENNHQILSDLNGLVFTNGILIDYSIIEEGIYMQYVMIENKWRLCFFDANDGEFSIYAIRIDIDDEN